MKRMTALLCALLTVMLLFPVCAEETAPAPMVTFGSVTVPADAVYVDLGDQKVTNYNALYAFLDQLPQLERFDMFSTKIQRTQLERLAERYPNVQFGWTITFTCNNKKHALRTDATAWSTLHNNQSSHHTSADFSVLRYCPNLVALDIGHNGVTDLSFLDALPNLRVLIIACNNVTDITPLGRLTQLQYLEIFKNRITDLSPLANCTELLDLNICFNRISDYSPIMNLPKLERLWLYCSNNYSNKPALSRTVIADLKAAYPQAVIDTTHYSTNGGWRTHPRYDIINRMFTTAEYIPFEE